MPATPCGINGSSPLLDPVIREGAELRQGKKASMQTIIKFCDQALKDLESLKADVVAIRNLAELGLIEK